MQPLLADFRDFIYHNYPIGEPIPASMIEKLKDAFMAGAIVMNNNLAEVVELTNVEQRHLAIEMINQQLSAYVTYVHERKR